MSHHSEIEQLRAELAELKRQSRKTKWLMRQIRSKIAALPNDLKCKFQRAANKRRSKRARAEEPATGIGQHSLQAEFHRQKHSFFCIAPGHRESFDSVLTASDAAHAEVLEQYRFARSGAFEALVADAAELEPSIYQQDIIARSYLAPFHDQEWHYAKTILDRLPDQAFDTVILVPFGKMGGADFVAGILSKVLSTTETVLILRTDAPDWERPEWYAPDAVSVDLSEPMRALANPCRCLYAVLQKLKPKRVFNVNSRIGFDLFEGWGDRLSQQFELNAYFFCSDYTMDGKETGYPVWYFVSILRHLSSALFDTQYLVDRMEHRYALPDQMCRKLKTVYTPAMGKVGAAPVVMTQISSASRRERPALIWAGRFDRQKRFDLLLEIAEGMPEIDFLVWGKAVLDAAPSFAGLPGNVQLHPPFTSFDELPLETTDGWIYTAAWDGLPTILIECAGRGVPIVASAVGGVPELIDETTGWPVQDVARPQAYIEAIAQMLSSPTDRQARATAAQDRVRARHTLAAYRSGLGLTEPPEMRVGAA